MRIYFKQISNLCKRIAMREILKDKIKTKRKQTKTMGEIFAKPKKIQM